MTADSQAFPRAHRLLSAEDYRKVFQQAHKASDRWFTVLARPNGGGSARLGLAVAKKQLKKAVDRNRLKRLIRESFRLHPDELRGLDLVVMVRSNAAQQDNASLSTALGRLWAEQARWRDQQAHSE